MLLLLVRPVGEVDLEEAIVRALHLLSSLALLRPLRRRCLGVGAGVIS